MKARSLKALLAASALILASPYPSSATSVEDYFVGGNAGKFLEDIQKLNFEDMQVSPLQEGNLVVYIVTPRWCETYDEDCTILIYCQRLFKIGPLELKQDPETGFCNSESQEFLLAYRGSVSEISVDAGNKECFLKIEEICLR